MSQPETESYTAAKGGISALTHALAVSLSGKVRVNSISPGWIDNNDTIYEGADAVQQPVGRVGNPLDIANMVLYLCSDMAGFITGENICIEVWDEVMSGLHSRRENEDTKFDITSKLREYEFCRDSGMLVTDACESDNFAEVEYQQENNHRQSKNQRGIGSEYNQAEKEAVHGRNRFTAAEVCENRVAMADCCSKTAADSSKLCADEMLCKKDNQSYFQQVKSHDSKACFFTEDTACITAAEIFTAVVADIIVVEQLGKDNAEVQASKQIRNGDGHKDADE